MLTTRKILIPKQLKPARLQDWLTLEFEEIKDQVNQTYPGEKVFSTPLLIPNKNSAEGTLSFIWGFKNAVDCEIGQYLYSDNTANISKMSIVVLEDDETQGPSSARNPDSQSLYIPITKYTFCRVLFSSGSGMITSFWVRQS